MNTTRNIINRWQSNISPSRPNKETDRLLDKIKKNISAAVADSIHDEVFASFDCLECANCCKSIPPIVSGRDARRISSYLGLSRKAFEQKYLTLDTDGDTIINSTPCPFLGSDNRCDIYEVRPAACRQYPHSGDSTFIKHISLHKRNVRYCPALYEIIKRLENVV